MSTSLLYHTFGVKNYSMLPGTRYGAAGTIFKIAPHKWLIRCPECGSKEVVKSGSERRRLRAPQVGHNKRVFLEVDVPVVICKHCGVKKQIKLGIADSRKSYTKAYALNVINLLRLTSVLGVAMHFGVSWTLVNSILKDFLEKWYPKKKLFKGLREIAIDETSIGKGQDKYITIVYDLDRGEPVYVAEGKGEEALDGFWPLVGERALKKIECVAIDLGAAYQAAVRNNLPNAIVVFDRFHVVKLANKALDEIRRREQSRPEFKGDKVLKGNRFLLLRNREDITDPEAIQRLKNLLALNKPLAAAYILKEDLRQFWEKGGRGEAEAAIASWVATALNSGDPILARLGRTIEKHKEGILAHYKYPISSGPLEGFNNKVKVLIRRAYGYRNKGMFILLVLAINEFNPKTLQPKFGGQSNGP